MVKQVADTKTIEMLPIPAKRGRKPKGDKPMSSAERMALMRERKAIKILALLDDPKNREFILMFEALCSEHKITVSEGIELIQFEIKVKK